MHGGLSTGPKTAEGIERIRAAVTKHGAYSAAAKEERRNARELTRNMREFLASGAGGAGCDDCPSDEGVIERMLREGPDSGPKFIVTVERTRD